MFYYLFFDMIDKPYVHYITFRIKLIISAKKVCHGGLLTRSFSLSYSKAAAFLLYSRGEQPIYCLFYVLTTFLTTVDPENDDF